MEIIANSANVQEGQQSALLEFKGRSILTTWGNKRSVMVIDIVFDKTPYTKFFESNGKNISVAEYFYTVYKREVKFPDQPLFRARMGKTDSYLPTEFCSIDGVPDSIRADSFKMANVLKSCRKNPDEKYSTIHKFSSDLFEQQVLKEWGVSV